MRVCVTKSSIWQLKSQTFSQDLLETKAEREDIGLPFMEWPAPND